MYRLHNHASQLQLRQCLISSKYVKSQHRSQSLLTGHTTSQFFNKGLQKQNLLAHSVLNGDV